METLLKMLNVISWICVTGCPLVIVIKVCLQSKYENSLDEKIDMLKGVKTVYTRGLLKLSILFVVALVYLIVR